MVSSSISGHQGSTAHLTGESPAFPVGEGGYLPSPARGGGSWEGTWNRKAGQEGSLAHTQEAVRLRAERRRYGSPWG